MSDIDRLLAEIEEEIRLSQLAREHFRRVVAENRRRLG